MAQRAQLTVAFRDATGHIEHKSECEVGSRGCYRVGSIRNRNAFFEAIGNVDIVIADGIVGH